MSLEERGARLPAQPLPEARRLRRALESLGVTAHSGQSRNPHGERGDAAQLAGILHGTIEQIETGLRGGALQTQFQKGWMTGLGRDHSQILGTIGEQLKDLALFAGSGIQQVPLASRQFSTAALALLVAHQAFAAASEIAVEDQPDYPAAEALSDEMVRQADELARYVDKLKAEFGAPEGRAQISIKDLEGD